MEFVSILGVRIAAGERKELLRAVAEMVGRGGVVSTPNPEIMTLSTENSELREALTNSFNIPDGIGVCRVIASLGYRSDVYPGVELGEELLSVAKPRLAIIGGKEGVAKRALERLSLEHEGITPTFAACGYGIDEEKIVSEIRTLAPSVVFVCLGAPRQEIFAARLHSLFPGVLFMTLGGSVDVYAGEVKRAPRILRDLRLEWLYRILREPSRIGRFKKSISFFSRIKTYNGRA